LARRQGAVAAAVVLVTLTSTSRLLQHLIARLAGYQPTAADEPGAIWAAVALVLVPDPDSLLLIRRAERPGDPWAGHIGLPGGRRDLGDADLLATAVREASEEVGIELNRDASIGLLDDVAPRTPVLPPVAVRPFVFALPARPPLRLNPEVAEAYWVELGRLRDPSAIRPYSLTLRGEPRTFPAYHIDELVVWGMTERILSSFFQVVLP
jgi:8-oxo-dGTP pyrophosphatase MutT (NUDIX family)